MDRIHWFSAGMTALSRGINDSAKIWAILLPLSLFSGLLFFQNLILLVVAAAMLAGSLLFGRRVAERLAFGIVPMSGTEGTAANLVTAATIIGASLLNFPVASSHVVSGAIVGVGLTGNRRLLRWPSLATMASAWVLTLPAAALLSGALYSIFQRLARSTISELAMGMLALVSVALIMHHAILAARPAAAPIVTRLIVFVCGSNTSRSPMAERICASLLARIRLDEQVTLLSRGLTATEGEPLAFSAVAALERLRVSAPPHASANLDRDVVDRADFIFCMTADQVTEVQRRFPHAAGKVLRLDPVRDVANPAGLEASAYVTVAAHLSAALDSRLNTILMA
jgi:protein-tyrosine-phosphatase